MAPGQSLLVETPPFPPTQGARGRFQEGSQEKEFSVFLQSEISCPLSKSSRGQRLKVKSLPGPGFESVPWWGCTLKFLPETQVLAKLPSPAVPEL